MLGGLIGFAVGWFGYDAIALLWRHARAKAKRNF